ncbi:Bud-site selection protein [Thozetella sp. PMI_491]|nr:Bud-site selection protein [Thozetella sp. PMI_491]
MPKRKRSGKEAAEARFAEHKAKLYSILWDVKGHLRQWQSKQLRSTDKKDPKNARAKRAANGTKKARVEKEVLVLKALDLHQAAHAHLVSSLLRISAIADAPELPDEIKKGVVRPEIPEDDKAALHNVTSALYNRPEVRKAIERAIEAICDALEVPVPDKKGKDKKKKKNGDSKALEAGTEPTRPLAKEKASRPKEPKDQQRNLGGRTDNDLDDDEQELAVSRFDDMLGSSSGDCSSDSDLEDEGAELDSVEKDPMEITSGSEEDDGFDDISLGDDEDETEDEDESALDENSELKDDESDASDSDSDAIERPPPRKKAATTTKTGKSKPTESVFLPTLMGGYISGSESASDVDVAPTSRKNRRGQKARQAIWEKRYRQEARHLKSGGATTWDPKRGAVTADRGKPWEKGPRAGQGGSRREHQQDDWPRGRPGPQKSQVDTGPLHPSWEAKKKAKAMEKTAKFEGTKVRFD